MFTRDILRLFVPRY